MERNTQIEVAELDRRHRDAMLDLVLTWASIDGALSMLLADVRGVSWVDAAADVRKLRGSKKLAEVVAALADQGDGAEAAKKLRAMKRRYERFSRLRDHIAHSRCIGVNKKRPDNVVFLTFERVGKDQLAMYEVPIDEMHRAQLWGGGFLELLYHWTRRNR